MPTIVDQRGRRISLSRNGEIAILDMDGRERVDPPRALWRAPAVRDGHIVTEGDRIAEWDPFIHAGHHREGGHREVPGPDREPDDDRGDRRGDRHRPARRHRRPRHAEEGGSASAPHPARRGFGRGGALHAGAGRDRSSVEDGQKVEAGDVLARVMPRKPPRRATSPAVCRASPSCSRRASPRRMRSSPRSPAGSTSARTTRPSARSRSSPTTGRIRSSTWCPKSKMIDVQEGDYVKRGDNLIGGSPDPHDILEVLGIEPLAEYLVSGNPGGLSTPGREDQRQAHRGDRSPDAAEGRDHRRRRHHLLAGEQVDREEMDEINAKLKADGASRPRASRCCSASPRRRCRPAASSRRRRSRRPRACSPRRRSRARSTR